MPIPLLVPDMPSAGELMPYLERIDKVRWYTNFGPLVTELELRLAAGHVATEGILKAQAVANATLGIELALASLNIPPGARILIPAVTFTATASAVVRNGYVPVIGDVDPQSWLLTPAIARDSLEKTDVAAVIPVCAYGCPQDAAAWDDFSSRTGIHVIIDAAGAFGNQRRIGRAPVIFSLHATKSLGAGEGGYVACTDEALLQRVRRLSNFGIDISTGYTEAIGTNAKLSEYHAAVALAALDRWEERRAARVALHREYLSALKRHCPGVTLQQRPADGAYTIMPVLLPMRCDAEKVSKQMATKGIGTRRWYCPTLNEHPAYKAFPVAEPLDFVAEINERLLGLPFFPTLSSDKIDYVCDTLEKAYRV